MELVDGGPLLEPEPVTTDRERACVAFSGGKDRLVLTALVAELTERPLAVTVTSPVAWARDHVGAARYRAREEIAARLGIEMIEVRSDFRTAWEMAFSARDGCRLGVHEFSDLPLYHGVMAVVAAARGIGRLSLASEADIQYSGEGDGGVILHPEFPSCAVAQSALDALWRRSGCVRGSSSTRCTCPRSKVCFCAVTGRWRTSILLLARAAGGTGVQRVHEVFSGCARHARRRRLANARRNRPRGGAVRAPRLAP